MAENVPQSYPLSRTHPTKNNFSPFVQQFQYHHKNQCRDALNFRHTTIKLNHQISGATFNNSLAVNLLPFVTASMNDCFFLSSSIDLLPTLLVNDWMGKYRK